MINQTNPISYFICPSCGKLTTSIDIDYDLTHGDFYAEMCDCGYMTYIWDNHYNGFEPIFEREFTNYVKISFHVYMKLMQIANDVKRLEAYRSYEVEKVK
jgi:hypothetical protein